MNLTNLADIRALLARHDFRFSKSLGQNFLTAAWVPADIADASGADAGTGVLEVGPGIGCLTEQLAQRADLVAADVEQAARLRPAEDALAEHGAHRVGKEGENVDAHALTSLRSGARPCARRRGRCCARTPAGRG